MTSRGILQKQSSQLMKSETQEHFVLSWCSRATELKHKKKTKISCFTAFNIVIHSDET